MSTFLIFAILSVGAAVVAFLFKLWRLVNQSLPQEKPGADHLEEVSTRLNDLHRLVGDLQSQLGRDSAFREQLSQVLTRVEKASVDLIELRGQRETDRREFVQKLSEVQGRLERVYTTLTGRRSGLAGENIVREQLRHLPPEWVVSPYKDVEFGLLLYDRRVIPIDSKFAATELLEQMERLEGDGQEKQLLSKKIEHQVLSRAGEVSKYLDPFETTDFAICAVPDSVYMLLRQAPMKSYQDHRVVIVCYSMMLPYLLSLYDLHLKSVGQWDEKSLEAFLSSLEQSLKTLKENLENKVKDANTRLSNAYRECVQAVGSMEGALSALKSSRLKPALKEEVR